MINSLNNSIKIIDFGMSKFVDIFYDIDYKQILFGLNKLGLKGVLKWDETVKKLN